MGYFTDYVPDTRSTSLLKFRRIVSADRTVLGHSVFFRGEFIGMIYDNCGRREFCPAGQDFSLIVPCSVSMVSLVEPFLCSL